MIFEGQPGRIPRRVAAAIIGAGALLALAACGGGSYQAQAFVPARIVVFGDESSRLEGAQGLKYSINGVAAQSHGTDCTALPIWTQTVASYYGLVFSNCNPAASLDARAIDHTVVGGTVQDAARQVVAFQAGDTFNGNDLVLVWVGMHDILDAYQANATGDETVLLADMRAAGAALGSVVNGIAATGAKVIVLTVPDMSESPFAYLESQRGDFDRLKLLADMSRKFNLGLRISIVNDGSKIGIVLVDDIVRDDTTDPGRFGLLAQAGTRVGCLAAAPLPTCTQDTLVDDPSIGLPSANAFLWADATHLGSTAQAQIGGQARDRARGNPF